MSPTHRTRRAALALAVAVTLLAGCTADGADDAADGSTPAPSTTVRPSDTTDETTDETTTTTEADSGADGEKAAYIDAVADAMREADDSDFPIDDEQSDCLAPKWVDAIGYETLIEVGVTPEVLGGTEDGDDDADFEDVVDRPRAEKLIAAFGDCGIDLEELFYDGLASDGSATPDQVDCLRGRLPDGFVQDLMITTMDNGDGPEADSPEEDPNLERQLTDAFMACLVEG